MADFRWTEDNVKKLLKMRADNVTYHKCAEHFGITPGMVSGFLSRYNRGEATIASSVAPFEWTDELLAKAEKMWKAGSKEKEVCEEIGCTVGSFRRIRLSYRERFPKAQIDRYRRGLQEARRSNNIPKVKAAKIFELEERPGDGSKYRISGITSVRFVDVRSNQCKFMLSDRQELNGAETHCCGAKTEGGPYCAAHSALIYVSPLYRIGRA